MDLGEALSFIPVAQDQPPQQEPIKNRSGLVHSCSTSSAIFHYTPQTSTLSIHNISDNENFSLTKHSAHVQMDDVIHISCSNDGRMVLVLHSDGSATCLDVTCNNCFEIKMNKRWSMEGLHSHDSKYGCGTYPAPLLAGAQRGPVHSVTFRGYECLIVDANLGCMILNCQAIGERKKKIIKAGRDYLCGDWKADNEIVLGREDGSVEFISLSSPNTRTITKESVLVPPVVEENDEDVNWSCTHVHCFHGSNSIAVGFCRIFPEDGVDEDDNYDSDEDDVAQHEATMLIYDINRGEWTDLGDIVAFFGVPMHGRHIFHSQYFKTCEGELLLVACNVTGEVGVVAKSGGDDWAVYELQEGSGATAPITEDDEFSVPTGLSVAVNEDGRIIVVLSATDGSLSLFCLEHSTNDNFGVYTDKQEMLVIGEKSVETVSLESEHEPETETSQSQDESSPDVPSFTAPFGRGQSTGFSFGSKPATSLSSGNVATSTSTSGFGFGSSASTPGGFGSPTPAPAFGQTSILTSSSTAFGNQSAQSSAPTFGQTSAFGSSPAPFGSPSAKTTAPTFGQTSTFGSSPAPFGNQSAKTPLPASSVSATFGSPSFGLSSATPGNFSLAPTREATSTPKLSITEKNAPIFGSGSKAPVFGSGGNIPSFSSTSANSGFGSLAATAGSAGFGALAETNKIGFGTPQKSPFVIFINPLSLGGIATTFSNRFKSASSL